LGVKRCPNSVKGGAFHCLRLLGGIYLEPGVQLGGHVADIKLHG
jgi:hypothetical protein